MNTLYKSILISLIALAANNAFSADYAINAEKVAVEPRFQLTLLPGFERSVKKPLAMHMVEKSNHNDNLLYLNSSLSNPNKTIETEKYFNDIEVTNNNLFELKF